MTNGVNPETVRFVVDVLGHAQKLSRYSDDFDIDGAVVQLVRLAEAELAYALSDAEVEDA